MGPNRGAMITQGVAAPMYAEPDSGLYAPDMAKRVLLSVQELRRTIGKLTSAVDQRKEHVVLSKRGKPFAVTVPIEWYRQAAEKMDDPTEY